MSESIALLVGATELMPGNASRVARGLRTITLGLQGMDDEGTESFELVSKLQTQFDKLGISLAGADGQLRSSYDILYDLNGVWGTLDKNTKVYISELIAGKNQVDVFTALMSNFTSVVSANETALNSAGSAAKENAAYMESLEAKVSALKQTFQELSTSLIDDDVAGLVLDIANSFLELVDTPVGRILAMATAITAVTLAAKGLFGAIHLGTNLMAMFGTGVSFATAGLAAFNWPLLLIIGSISALIAFAPQIKDFFDGLVDPVGNATKKIEDNNNQLETNKARLEEINNIPWYDRTPEIDAEAKALEALNKELEKANEGQRKKAANSIFGDITKDRRTKTDKVEGYTVMSANAMEASFENSEEAALKRLQQYSGKAYDSIQQAIDAGEYLITVYEVITQTSEEYYNSILEEQKEFNKEIEANGELVAKDRNKWTENTKVLSDYVANIEAINKLGFGELITKDMEEFADKARIVVGSTNKVVDALKEQDRVARITSKGFKITEEAAKDFISANAELAKSIALVNGEFFIEQQSLYDLAMAGNTTAQQMIKDQVALTEAVIQGARDRVAALKLEMEALQATMNTHDVLAGDGQKEEQRFARKASNDLALIVEKEKELNALNSAIKSWPNNNPLSSGSSGSKSSTKTSILEAFKKEITAMEHQVFLLTKADAEANAGAIVQIYEQMQQAVNAKANELRAKGYSETSDEIIELQKMWWGYSDEIEKVYDQIAETQKKFLDESEKALKAHLEAESAYYKELADKQQEIRDGYQDQADAYKIYANFVKESIDEQIKVYQKEIDALEKANEERENEIALQEKLNNLAKAKSTQVMVYKDGRFQYTNDIDAVSSAQNDLNEYQRERQLEKEKQYWQDKIDELQTYKDEWNSFTKSYEDNANLQILIQSKLFVDEDLIFSNRIKSAQTFADKYSEAMSRAAEAALKMEEYQAKSNTLSNQASNLGSDNKDWSQIWRDADAAQKSGALTQEQANAIKVDAQFNKAKEMAQVDSGAKLNTSTGKWYNPTTGQQYANGTLSASGGMSLVGEKGPEMRVLNSGDGIIPADVTKNLWSLGSNPYAFMSNAYKALAGTSSSNTTYQFAIDKLELPNVPDAPSLIAGLRNYAHQRASQRV